MKTKYYSMPQAVKAIGIPYHRVYFAIATGKFKPHTAGHSRILSETDVAKLKAYFRTVDAEKAVA